MKNLLESALDILRQYVEKNGGIANASKLLDMPEITLRQWIDGKRKPRFSNISPVLERLGVSLALPKHEAAKDVCFVNARLVDAVDGFPPPSSEDYTAAPLVGEVGAGPGYLPQDEIKSWFLVYSNLPAVRYRRNLIAVEIAQHSTSMQPTLYPGDIVLVDRDDRDVTQPGHMMLVMDPLDSSGMIKRVSVHEKGDDFQITYYSDNTSKYPPSMYSLKQDFYGDWDKSIVGRVIWAWSDMRNK